MPPKDDNAGGHDGFTEFIHTLQRIITLIVEYTWYLIREVFFLIADVIGFAFMLASCFSPTRTLFSPYVYFYLLFMPLERQHQKFAHTFLVSLDEINKLTSYRKLLKQRKRAFFFGFTAFYYAVTDIILMIMTIIILCTPTRTVPLIKELYLCFRRRKYKDDLYQYNRDYRSTIASNFCLVFLDTFGIVLFLISICLTPCFAVAYIRSVTQIFFKLPFKYYGVYFAEENRYIVHSKLYGQFQHKRSLHFSRMAFTCFSTSFYDVCVTLPCVVLSLVAPHRIIFILMDIATQIKHINSAECQILVPIDERSYDYELHNNEENESVEMKNCRSTFRHTCIINCLGSMIDIIAVPLAIVGLFCGFHGHKLASELKNAFRFGGKCKREDYDQQIGLFGVVLDKPFYYRKYLDANGIPQTNQMYLHRSYNFTLRITAISFGFFFHCRFNCVTFLNHCSVGGY